MRAGMRRMIMIGAIALALLLGTLATFSQPASARGRPINCSGLNGTITFGTPISKYGTPTTSAKALQTTISGSHFSCGSSTSSYSPITITRVRNTSNPTYSPTYCQVHPSIVSACDRYVTGTQGEWDATPASFKRTMKAILLVIGGRAVDFKISGALAAFSPDQWCPVGDYAAEIIGHVRSRFYPDRAASVTLCLSGDTGPNTTGSFPVDLRSTNPLVQIDTATLDPASSVATL